MSNTTITPDITSFAYAFNNISSKLDALSVALSDLQLNPRSLIQFYSTILSNGDPLYFAFLLCTKVTFIVYFHALFTGKTYLVDRTWSVLPIFYIAVFAFWPLLHEAVTHQRLVAHFFLVFFWGLRLSYNFARKGGYTGDHEDYRWKVVRSWPRMQYKIIRECFNFFFYAFYQNFLLMALCNSAYLSYLTRQESPFLNWIDGLAIGCAITFLIGEIIADQQQWNFQTEKYRLIAASSPLKGDYSRGFLTSGLFKFTRHPNFFCEFMFWYSNYLFGVAATGVWINWTLMGPILLNLLFLSSTGMTEKISAEKYPDYVRYQSTTSRLIPCVPGAPLDDKNKNE